MIGRHPETPAQHPHGLFDQALEALRADQLLERRQAALEQRRQDEVVDAEQRRGDDQLITPDEGLVEEQLDPAAGMAEVDRPHLLNSG